jgi:hypothetical protein
VRPAQSESSRRALVLARLVAVSLCGALAFPLTASAARPAKFRVTASGTDTESWSYRSANGCQTTPPTEFVNTGSETVRYRTARPVVISARPPVGGDEDIDPTAKLPTLGPGPNRGARFPVNATITRQATVTRCRGDSDSLTGSDCGTKSFSILGNLRFLTEGRGLAFFSMAASRRYPFRSCHNYFGRARGSVGIGTRESAARLSTKTLFNPRKRRFRVTARSVWRSPRHGARFETTWTATFRRIR